MIGYYRRALVRLHGVVREIQANPGDTLPLCLEVQEELVRRITYLERRIQGLRETQRALSYSLRSRGGPRHDREAARCVKVSIQRVRGKIEDYRNLIYIFRSLGDGLAFIYLSKWDIKPMTFRESPGFISGKSGLRLELQFLRQVFSVRACAILTGITNCLRYGDLIVPSPSGAAIIEVKSSDRNTAQTRRQQADEEKISSYLATGRGVDLHMPGWTTVRTPLMTKEVTHETAMNTLIREAYEKGIAIRTIEPGLTYLMDISMDIRALQEACGSMVNQQFVFIANSEKYTCRGYTPYCLTIRNSEAFVDLYRGSLFIYVFVDLDFLRREFARRGMQVAMLDDGEWAMELTPNDGKHDGKKEPMRIGWHLFGRVGMEFASLAWLIEDVCAQYRVGPPTAA